MKRQYRVPVRPAGLAALAEKQPKQQLRRGEIDAIKGLFSAKTGKKYDAALKVEKGPVVPVFTSPTCSAARLAA